MLYGEILGSDVQSLSYRYEGYEGYRAFDLMIDGRYLDFGAFWDCCDHYDVPMVPAILGYVPFDLDVIRNKAKGNTWLEGDHICEGVVVKPVIERSDPRIGRVVLKFVSDDFLLAKHSDFAEV